MDVEGIVSVPEKPIESTSHKVTASLRIALQFSEAKGDAIDS